MKVAVIAEAKQIELERFTFDQPFIGNVGNADGGKIRLSGNRANAGKFGSNEIDKVIVAGMFVGKRFENVGRISVRHDGLLIAKQGNACGLFVC